jgi:hypothetical protein
MKFYGSLFALCALASVEETSAFVGQAPKAFARTSSPQESSTSQKVTNSNVSNGVTKAVPPPGTRSGLTRDARTAGMQNVKEIWNTLSPVKVQGGSLRTWSFASTAVERVQVLMKTEGRPLNANVELWQGPDNTPQKMGVYLEDGNIRPFSAVIETPRGSNTIAIRNTASVEFPLDACVEADSGSAGLGAVTRNLSEKGPLRTIQGGAVHTIPFAPSVSSVQVLLKTDGRPLNARLELLQGPNNNKQVIELYTEDGLDRPFFAIIETPGTGNVVRIVNTATVEFPLSASVEPYMVEPGSNERALSGVGTGGNYLQGGQVAW